ncbi:MAG: hypothetical protein M1828_004279 [Chrysothrix sp. TS-e1954]|nr:MAG: hypothetical protein M1828_004279 [Chrysothrix sp. TS-e1954]
MVSMWGSKKNGEHDGAEEGDGGSRSRPTSQDVRDPDERTGLLSNNRRPHTRDGHLDPDDPAVSPYNLWTVRFLRYITVFFAMITFVWWVILFVSIFVTPPGMHTRGSGYTDFSYTTLTLGNLLVALLFFTGPSKAMRIFLSIVAVLLLADIIIIATVNRVRIEEGWPGVASATWAVLVAVWCVMTDRVVEWGKREEEERLTGRPESRRTLGQWLAVLAGTVIVFAYILITILLTGTLILRAIDAGLAPDGERIFVDGHKYQVHLACIGNVTETNGQRDPTILVEAGEKPSEHNFEKWVYTTFENGTIGRYCYWDRPGYGWSDNAPSPHSAGASAYALSEALASAGETGPWISVSAGYGSVVARIFASRHLRQVRGMMLIDPMHEDLLYRLASPGRGFALWGYGIISPLGIQRLGGALFLGRTKEDRVFGKSESQTGKFLKARLQENLVADSLSKNELMTSRDNQSKRTPVVLVSSGIQTGKDHDWLRKQEDLSKLTKRVLSWDIVAKAPHEVWRTFDGRQTLERRLGELIEASMSRK